jgi:pilus assembly protein Flp/PilA
MMSDRQDPDFDSRRRRTERGATSLEYALIASLISVVIIAGVTAVGESNRQLWTDIVNKIVAALG